MNTNMKGNVALGRAIQWFTEDGWIVSIPLTDSQSYDLIVDKYGSPCRVSVRTANQQNKSGNYYVGLRVVGRSVGGSLSVKPFDKTAVDYLLAISPTGMYLIPSSDIEVLNALTLNERFRKVTD